MIGKPCLCLGRRQRMAPGRSWDIDHSALLENEDGLGFINTDSEKTGNRINRHKE
jgi:hypothetical protein